MYRQRRFPGDPGPGAGQERPLREKDYVRYTPNTGILTARTDLGASWALFERLLVFLGVS